MTLCTSKRICTKGYVVNKVDLTHTLHILKEVRRAISTVLYKLDGKIGLHTLEL